MKGYCFLLVLLALLSGCRKASNEYVVITSQEVRDDSAWKSGGTGIGKTHQAVVLVYRTAPEELLTRIAKMASSLCCCSGKT